MDENQNLSIVISVCSILFSGLLGVFISNWFNKRQQQKNLKLDLVKNILGYSYQLVEEVERKEEFILYLNQIYVIFNSSKKR